MITFAILAFLPVFPVAPLAPTATPRTAVLQQDDSVLVRYDLRNAMPRFDSGGWDENLLSAMAGATNRSVNAFELTEVAPAETVVDLIANVLGDDLHFEGRSMTLDGNAGLLVHAPVATQSKVRQILDGFKAAFLQSLDIQVDVFTLSKGAGDILVDDNVVSMETADRLASDLLALGAKQVRHSFQLEAGRTSVVEQMRSVSLLESYEVQIATGSVGFSPVTVDLRLGMRMLMGGHHTATGTKLSLVFQQHSLVDVIHERPYTTYGVVQRDGEQGYAIVPGPTRVQSAEVHSASVACTTFLPDGNAVVLSHESNYAGKIRRQVLVLRHVGTAPSPMLRIAVDGSDQDVLFVNSGAFRQPELRFSLDLDVSGDGENFFSASSGENGADFLSSWISPRFAVWRRFGSWFVLVTSPSWDGQSGAQLERLMGSIQSQEQTRDVEVNLTEEEETRGVRWSLPVLTGSTFGLVELVTANAIVEFQTEVASNSMAVRGYVEPVFDGLMGVFGVSSDGERSIVDVDGRGYRSERPFGAIVQTGLADARIDLVETDSITFHESRRLAAGDQVLLGSGSPLTLKVTIR